MFVNTKVTARFSIVYCTYNYNTKKKVNEKKDECKRNDEIHKFYALAVVKPRARERIRNAILLG